MITIEQMKVGDCVRAVNPLTSRATDGRIVQVGSHNQTRWIGVSPKYSLGPRIVFLAFEAEKIRQYKDPY